MPTEYVAPGITRFDFETRKGFMVRLKRGKKRINIWLPDKKHGGKRKTLALAKKKYNELVSKLGPVRSSTLNKLTVRNTSGHVGVHFDEGYDSRYGSSNETYVASWLSEQGKRTKISFSIGKYGKRKAFELACIARENRLKNREKILRLYEKKKAGTKTTKKKRPKHR